MSSADSMNIDEAIRENVRRGYVEFAGIGDDGEPRYRLTDAGEAAVRGCWRGDEQP